MADRYRVLNGDWDRANSWSTTSGGVGGASVPTSSDNVYFDANTPLGSVVINTTASVGNLDFTGYSGMITGADNLNITIYGSSVILSATMTNTFMGGFWFIIGDKTLTCNGIPLNRIIIEIGAVFTLTISDKLTLTNNSASQFAFYKVNGIFNPNGQDVEFTGINTRILGTNLTFYNLIKSSIGTIEFYRDLIIENSIQINGNKTNKQYITVMPGYPTTTNTMVNNTGSKITLSNCNIQYIAFSGDDWEAVNSIDSGNNSGIDFTDVETISKLFCYDLESDVNNVYKSVNVSLIGLGLEYLDFYIGEYDGVTTNYTKVNLIGTSSTMSGTLVLSGNNRRGLNWKAVQNSGDITITKLIITYTK